LSIVRRKRQIRIIDERSAKGSESHGAAGHPAPSAEDALPVVGETVNFEDYLLFQKAEGTASDLESLVTLEKAWAKYESRMFRTPRVMLYVMAAIVLVIGLGIGLYIMKELGILPI